MRTRQRKLAVVATALAVSASVAGSAAARAPAPGGGEDREAQRTELYREAVKAAAAGHWLESRERLRAALAIRSSPKVLFSLAQTEEQLGQLASAQADYARALQGAALEGKGDVVRAAELAERALAPRVPHLRIVLAGAGAGAGADHGDGTASATLDDQPVALAATVPVDLGDHRVTVNARGMRTATAIVKLGEGQQLELPVVLEAERPAPALAAPSSPPASAPAPARPPLRQDRDSVAVPAAPRTTSSPLRTAGLVTAGLGVVALGAGAAFGVASIAKHDDAERACPGAACGDANGVSLWHDAVTFGNLSTAALVVGGVGVVVGAVLWLAAPSSSGASAEVGLGPGSIQLREVW